MSKKIMEEETYSMDEECTNDYYIKDLNEREVEIRMVVPKMFENLWICKLSDLWTTEKEIEKFEKEEG